MDSQILELIKELQGLEKRHKTYSFILYEFNIKINEEIEKVSNDIKQLNEKLEKLKNNETNT